MFVYSKPIDGVTVAGEMERSGLYTDDTRGYLVQPVSYTHLVHSLPVLPS